ncbi:hypothetical protein DL770_009147 [Monosporascus sp. CRB-9-2]|nr:hypothetical protein DL770_009147 [Monosporascus sp. CRB-9-2]
METDADVKPPCLFRQNDDGKAGKTTRDLTDLPSDVFLLIISHLSPQDSILCRRVSRAWLAAFTSDQICRNFMRWHFPRCREMRNLPDAPKQPQWAQIFPRVAQRYYYLRAAKPRLVEKIDVVQETKQKGPHRGVEPWNRQLRFDKHKAEFQYRDPTWCVDDGVLVYRENVSGRYVAYDLETRYRFSIPFDGKDKTVRRLRLAYGVLIFEWCEREPYHQLNDRETVHRHFATAFDVQRSSSRSSSPQASIVRSVSSPSSWSITFRSEWKIHFLGLPLNHHDRFFSAHTATHYALYLWQPNRSPWGEEDPLEQLTVWDISFPSAYRPSLDPSGANRPDPDLAPVVVRRFTWRELEFLGLRQRHTPSLREILLDERNVYVHDEDHRWLVGQHSSLSPPRHHHVRCTGVPFVGLGPRWLDECCADGDVHMSFCPRAGSATARIGGARRPFGFDGTWPGWAPCWRHEEFPYLTVSDVVDPRAGIRVVARQCFMMEALSAFVLPKISVESGEDEEGEEKEEPPEVRFPDEMWAELMGKGRICGDERWVVGEDREGKVTVVRF